MLKINKEATSRLFREVLPLLPEVTRSFANTVRIHVTNHRKGRARLSDRSVRVPAGVFKDRVDFCGKGLVDGGLPFAAYYLAHELAHIKAGSGEHGASFMAAFKELCPVDVQWYESIYKPKSAAAAGIQKPFIIRSKNDSYNQSFST